MSVNKMNLTINTNVDSDGPNAQLESLKISPPSPSRVVVGNNLSRRLRSYAVFKFIQKKNYYTKHRLTTGS